MNLTGAKFEALNLNAGNIHGLYIEFETLRYFSTQAKNFQHFVIAC